MSRPRVAFFSHDGTGLGHLRRLCHAARAIQEECASLVITGQRAATWLVPDDSELVRLPSLDSMEAWKAGRWGRRPFMDRHDGLRLRRRIMEAALEEFRPDAFVVDHLALGKRDELRTVVETLDAAKYLVLRGILDEPRLAIPEVFGGAARAALEEHFDRILVAADAAVIDVAKEYELPRALRDKLCYLGFLVRPVDEATIRRIRRERGLAEGDKWVVCSAGGGAVGHDLTAVCRELSRAHPEVAFDIVYGPRSTAADGLPKGDVRIDGRTMVWREHRALPLLHAAAEVVVCQGGSNTLLEVLMGRARVIQVPFRAHDNREQPIWSRVMGQAMPIDVVDLEDVPAAVEAALEAARLPEAHAAVGPFDLRGASRFRHRLLADLGALPAVARPGGSRSQKE